MKIFDLLVIHISPDNVLNGLNFCIHASNMCVKDKSSQVFVLGLSFYLMPKTKKHFTHFFEYLFLNLIENDSEPIPKI